jgi:imidazole glycerol phosphate synthase glutamine amidotransferase subunit
MQLLADTSDESPGQDGLGVVTDTVTRFAAHLRVPQLGWNQVWPDDGSRFITPGWAYFANSYKLETPPAGWRSARADHGGNFVAAAESGDVLACQFHPELSGDWGARVVERWLTGASR